MPLLVENGPWRHVDDFLGGCRIGGRRATEVLARESRKVRRALGLRSDPLEFDCANGVWRVRAREIAGTLTAGDIVIDIAPKFVPQGNPDKDWDASLLMLMKHARPRHSFLQRSKYVSSTKQSFVDLMALAFVDSLRVALKDQLIQTYEVQEACLPTVRGRINIRRQARSVIQRPHLVECDVDQLDAENAYNNLIKWGARTLLTKVRSPILKRQLGDLYRILPGIPDRRLASRDPLLTLPPQFRSWAPALEICCLLLTGNSHATGRGSHTGYSFVFNMERLFESFLEKLLKRGIERLYGSDFECQTQVRTLYATSMNDSSTGFYSRPDNVIFEQNSPRAVVDAKYKRLSDGIGIRDRRPHSQDVYEIVAAMTAHGCSLGLLVYPKVASDSILSDGQLKVWTVDAFGKLLTVGAVAIDLMSINIAAGMTRIEDNLALSLRELSDISLETCHD